MPHHAQVYAAAALLGLATAVVLAVILRTFAGDPRPAEPGPRPAAGTGPARTARRPRPRPPIGDDYGLLRTLALVESLDTAQSVRALLDAGGIRATVATGSDGLVRVLVFPEVYQRARRMVSWAL